LARREARSQLWRSQNLKWYMMEGRGLWGETEEDTGPEKTSREKRR
jgi:hypothetical protein